MTVILLHLQMNIAYRELFIIVMLEYQDAIDYLQPGDIERPPAVARLLRQRSAFWRNGRIFSARGFSLRRQLHHRTFQHDLLHLQLVRK